MQLKCMKGLMLLDPLERIQQVMMLSREVLLETPR
jgi:hypothetical protein